MNYKTKIKRCCVVLIHTKRSRVRDDVKGYFDDVPNVLKVIEKKNVISSSTVLSACIFGLCEAYLPRVGLAFSPCYISTHVEGQIGRDELFGRRLDPVLTDVE